MQSYLNSINNRVKSCLPSSEKNIKIFYLIFHENNKQFKYEKVQIVYNGPDFCSHIQSCLYGSQIFLCLSWFFLTSVLTRYKIT